MLLGYVEEMRRCGDRRVHLEPQKLDHEVPYRMLGTFCLCQKGAATGIIEVSRLIVVSKCLYFVGW